MNKRHTLKDRESIYRLFQNGKKTSFGPVLLISLNYKQEAVLFSVSKKNIPKATERNKIKRQMRAIFLNNRRLLNVNTPKALAFIYLEKSTIEYSKLSSSMITILKNVN